MIRSTKTPPNINDLTFIDNTAENRREHLNGGERILAVRFGSLYRMFYDERRDSFTSRLGSARHYYPTGFQSFAILSGARAMNADDWGKAWARIANSMYKHHINLHTAILIDKMLYIGLDEMQRLKVIRSTFEESELYPAGMSYDEKCSIEKRETEAWEVTHAGILGDTRAWQLLSLGTQNHPAAGLPRVSKMKLDSKLIEEAIEKVNSGEKESDRVTAVTPKRDLTFSIWKHEGKILASYASEYSGCGNGAYYIPFSPSYAFYSEHD